MGFDSNFIIVRITAPIYDKGLFKIYTHHPRIKGLFGNVVALFARGVDEGLSHILIIQIYEE